MGAKKLHLYQRQTLQGCIYKELSLKETIKRMEVNRSTIYREIINNSTLKGRKSCSRCQLFDDKCNKRDPKTCNSFKMVTCPFLKRFPYVCNMCPRKKNCKRMKRYYDNEKANKHVKDIRRIHHLTVSVTEKQMSMFNEIISPAIRKRQSLHHIYVTNERLHIVSERTLRRYLYSNRFDVKAEDLPRFKGLIYKKAYRSPYRRVKDIAILLGRNYHDYLKYVEANKTLNIVQLDSVIGKINDGKAILTIYFPKTHFMFGRIISKGSPISVNKALISVRNDINTETYKKLFPIILSDNGTEFARLDEIEIDQETGEKLSNVYFCNPYASYQKGACEKNHEFIRYAISKGKTLDNLTNDDLNCLFSNINSIVRESLNNKSPFELTKEQFGLDFLNSIGIYYVEPTNVNLSENWL